MSDKINHMLLIMTSIILIIIGGCTEIFEEDISDEVLTIHTPLDNSIFNSSYVQFWWNLLDEATVYNIQVVTPSFDSVIRLLIDTNLSDNVFEWSFPSGEYSWRICAKNGSYNTAWQEYSFTIDSIIDLTNTQIIIISPIDFSHQKVQ
jgi:hypothetical protein